MVERINRSSESDKNPILSFFGLFLGSHGPPGIMVSNVIDDLVAGREVYFGGAFNGACGLIGGIRNVVNTDSGDRMLEKLDRIKVKYGLVE